METNCICDCIMQNSPLSICINDKMCMSLETSDCDVKEQPPKVVCFTIFDRRITPAKTGKTEQQGSLHYERGRLIKN